MPAFLEFGRDRRWPAPWREEHQWRRLAPRCAEPLTDPAAAVAAAVEDPLEFPPLKRALIPGDRVAIAVAPGLPQTPELVAGLLVVLEEAQVRLEDVTICQAAGEAELSGRSGSLLEKARQFIHRPGEREAMSYLAASATARPIYFPRVLCDADVVIPLGCHRPVASSSTSETGDALFPTFSDQATQQRLQHSSCGSVEIEEAAEAAWLLGVQFAVEVVPGARGSVLQVIAGDREAVRRHSRRLSETVWKTRIAHRVPAVIATVGTPQRNTTWQEVTHAIERLAPIVDPGGAIVLCTDLADAPTDRLLDDPRDDARGDTVASGVRHGAEASTDGCRSEENQCASALAELPRELRVYFVSQLPGDVVESTGMIPVSSHQELARLVSRFEGGLVVEDADRLVVELAETPDAVR